MHEWINEWMNNGWLIIAFSRRAIPWASNNIAAHILGKLIEPDSYYPFLKLLAVLCF